MEPSCRTPLRCDYPFNVMEEPEDTIHPPPDLEQCTPHSFIISRPP